MVVDGSRQYGQQYPAGLFDRSERNHNVVDRLWQGQYRLRRRKAAMPTYRIRNNISNFSGFTILLCLLSFLTGCSNAAFINFDNCLEASILHDPSQLQFVPLFFSVVYDTAPGPNPLNITIYGNITGATQGETAPSPGSPQWSNSSNTAGKIVNIVDNNGNEKYTTLFTELDVLSFTPYEQPTEFCATVTQGSCPLGPVFDVNSYGLLTFQMMCVVFS